MRALVENITYQNTSPPTGTTARYVSFRISDGDGGVSDASVLASAVDGALLLIQHRRNPAAMVERARQILIGLKTPLLGLILNQVPLNAGEDYGYYTSNYAYYSDGSTKPRRSTGGT